VRSTKPVRQLRRRIIPGAATRACRAVWYDWTGLLTCLHTEIIPLIPETTCCIQRQTLFPVCPPLLP
jgi:hypothetical protein